MQTGIPYTPVFVQTRNVRSFATMMQGLLACRDLPEAENSEPAPADARLGCVWGRAGRGKSHTALAWLARHPGRYMQTVSVWSELDFLQQLCRALEVRERPGRRGACFALALEALTAMGSLSTLFIDEIDRFGGRYLEMARDLAEAAGSVIVLIGEEELPGLMRRNRRVWSRTYRAMEFAGVSVPDVLMYVKRSTGLRLSPEAAAVMHRASGGDLRIVRRDTINLTHAARGLNRVNREELLVDAELARIACGCGLVDIK